jgi:hypothetical protein
MNPQQITNLVQQLMAKSSQSGRFNIQNIPSHIHNGVDSPLVYQPVLTYGGSVTSGGVSQFLPKSWTVKGGGGTYTIIHNLNTLLYVVNASAQSGSIATSATLSLNSFVVHTFSSGGPTASAFTFTLTNLNNKSTQTPVYTLPT